MSEVIIRFINASAFSTESFPAISRVAGFLDAKNFFKLQQSLGIESNPRQPKKSAVTTEIAETLKNTPEYFHLMSKGILLSATTCQELDRNRFKLSFEDNDYGRAGILDGGHNTFAIGRFMLSSVMSETEVRGVKDWPTYREAWGQYEAAIEECLEEFSFIVPVEVLFPSRQNEDSLRDWGEAIRDITHARNNNLQLTDATKDNFLGFYDFLKESLPKEIVENVEWKTNEGGRIKAADIVALSLIPLSCLPSSVAGSRPFNPVQIYNSKQACVEEFRKILSENGNGEWAGSNFTLKSPSVKSALSMTGKILEAYDLVYELFPNAYNSNEGKFGRIEDVRIYDPENAQTGNKKYSKKRFSSRYFEKEVDYQFADGFFVPIVVALRELIKFDEKSKQLAWVSDPITFLRQNLKDILVQYSTVIRMAKYDPQKIGKDRGSYLLAETSIRMVRLLQK